MLRCITNFGSGALAASARPSAGQIRSRRPARAQSRTPSPTDYRHALDLDQHARPREVGDRDQRACGKIAVREIALAQLDEAVAVARIVDEHRHGHEVSEAAAAAPERLVDKGEDRAHLRLELPGNVVARLVAGRGLSRQPYRASTLRDDGGRERARRLEFGLL